MEMGIERDYSFDTEEWYTVQLFGRFVHTTVTVSPSVVDQWISDIYRIHRRRLPRLIVGLDVEWRASFTRQRNPVVVLQLCVGHRCLIFQLFHAHSIPSSLSMFLTQPGFRFVGVGIRQDADKLEEDYRLSVSNALDLRPLAAEGLGLSELRQAGLKSLTSAVLGVDVDKSKRITMSRWDAEFLTPKQVQYACNNDAFLSFKIGKKLINGN